MKKFNLSTRIELFAVCTSIEQDLKSFILESTDQIDFTLDMLNKAKERKKNISDKPEDILNQLDLGDYVQIIASAPHSFNINNDKKCRLKEYFDKVIPVRNRVMHTKPLELGDRSLIIEVMETIDVKINWINWYETVNTRNIIYTNPSQLLDQKYIPIKEYNPLIYHNLPEPEFDDTGYIGRVKERKEIKDLILNHKNQIITIVGNGGLGKTAITLKILYDLIENDDCPFECVIWLTLKTKTLSNGEFIQIKDCIKNIPDLYKMSQSVIITDETIPSKEMLIKFMEDFKVLLVLDNLETINSNDISDFMKQIPEKSKVLITSRHGLGELEIRKKLDGLSKNDARTYFRELSKYYGLDLHKRQDSEIDYITSNNLYSNPLSIKWFISGVFNGVNEVSLLANKSDLINFCVSNVFEKLSDLSKNILQLFLLEKKKLSYGIIDYYLDVNEFNLKESINELLSTYMIQSVSSDFIMNEMSRDYISLNYPPSNDFISNIFGKRKKLKQIMQSVKVTSEQAPFNPQSISSKLDNDDKQLATFYLKEALKFSKEKKWENAIEYCEKAKNIAPDFFEVYKIQAFLDAERSENYRAINNYEIALSKCETSKEKSIVCCLFATFYVIKMQEYDMALEYIDLADTLNPNTSEILLEKARVYMFLGKYTDAESLLNRVREFDNTPTLRTQNIMATRYGELYRREAETFEMRDYQLKLEYLEQAITQFKKVEKLDIKSGIVLISILSDLSYLYFNESAMNLLADTIGTNFYILCKVKHKKKTKMCEFLKNHKEDINGSVYAKIEKFLADYRFVSSEIDEENEGVVVNLREYFGFIANQFYNGDNAIFFLRTNAFDNISLGDLVSFNLYKGKKGMAAKNIEKVRN